MDKYTQQVTEAQKLPPGCRCKKLNGKYIPQSCHVLNGRKQTCKDLIIPEGNEQAEIQLFDI